MPVVILSHALFSLGLFGLLTRRHAIGQLLAVELLLNAAALNFVAFGRAQGNVTAQAFTLFIIALAACEAVVGLAIVISLARTAHTIFSDDVSSLKG